MKRLLLFLTSSVLLLAGCAKENLAPSDLGEGLQTVTFTAAVEDGVATKAVADGDGAAANVNRCIMEVYYDGTLFGRQVQPVTDKKASFTMQMVSNRTYTVAFWADKATVSGSVAEGFTDLYYNASSLDSISIKSGYIGNDDARDAFFASDDNFTVPQGGKSFNVNLKRPFAQMNVITSDADFVNRVSSLKPTKVKVLLKSAYTTFNAVTGVVSVPSDIEYSADVYNKNFENRPSNDTTNVTLSMDYLFASESKEVIDIDFKAGTGDFGGGDKSFVAHSFAAVPYQRNYRTNIKGALLTTTGQWNVTVDPIWNVSSTGEFDYAFTTVCDIKGANDFVAQNTDKKEISVTFTSQPNDAGVPSSSTGKNAIVTSLLGQNATYNINVASTTDVLYVGDYDYDNSTQGTTIYDYDTILPDNSSKTNEACVNLVVSDNLYIGTLVVNSPSKSVSINGQSLQSGKSYHIENLTVTEVSLHTVIVESGMTVENLTMVKGGLEIHGNVHKAIVPDTHGVIEVRDCENLDETNVYNVLSPYIAEGYVGVKGLTTEGKWDIVPGTCKIDDKYFYYLSDAVNAAQDGETITVLKNINGDGVGVPGGKNLTIDFGGFTYFVDGNLAGSTGTKSQCFQLLSGSTIVFKNGTVKSNIAGIGINNYANLTLQDMTIDMRETSKTGQVSGVQVMNGNVKVLGNTNIYAKENPGSSDAFIAIMSLYWPTSYGDIDILVNTTGEVKGLLVYASYQCSDLTTVKDHAKFTLKDGDFDVTYDMDGIENPGFKVVGGLFAQRPDSKYMPNAYTAQPEGNKWRVVFDDSYVLRLNDTYYTSWDGVYQYFYDGGADENSEIEIIKNCTAPSGKAILKNHKKLTIIVNPGVTLTSNIGDALIATNPGATGVEIKGGGTIDCSNGTLVDEGHGGVSIDNVYVKAECLARNNVASLILKDGSYEKVGNYTFINSGCAVSIAGDPMFNYDVSAYTPAGKVCVEMSTKHGWYHFEVLTEENAAFKVVNGTTTSYYGATADYCKFDSSVEGWISTAQQDGDEITLLKDLQGYFILTKDNITLDLNGKTLSGSTNFNTYNDGAVCCLFGDNHIIKKGTLSSQTMSNSGNLIQIGLNCRLGNYIESMLPAKSVSVTDVTTSVKQDANNHNSVQYYNGGASYVTPISLSGVSFDSYYGRDILPRTPNSSQFTITIANGCRFYITQGRTGSLAKPTYYTNDIYITPYLTASQQLSGSGYGAWREVTAK